MIEEVRKITHKNCYWIDKKCPIPENPACERCEDDCQQICQLFEPKFNNALEADAHNWDTRELPKPDEGRLLTDEECRLVELRMGESLNWCQPILKAQRDLTASIIRAECQERVERIFKEIESKVLFPFTSRARLDAGYQLQALKKKELK